MTCKNTSFGVKYSRLFRLYSNMFEGPCAPFFNGYYECWFYRESLLFNAQYTPRFDLGWQLVRRIIMNLEYVRVLHICAIRNNKTVNLYTTLHYSNLKNYKFRVYDTLIISFTFHFSKIQGIHKRMVRFQKITRNLFLTLHGHNVHRQQRKLSKFLMRYQQFASHA